MKLGMITAQKKWSFPLRISSVNVHFTVEIFNGKLHFFVVDITLTFVVSNDTKYLQMSFCLGENASGDLSLY